MQSLLEDKQLDTFNKTKLLFYGRRCPTTKKAGSRVVYKTFVCGRRSYIRCARAAALRW